mmetsp:Transcript_24405/g.56245  ORF Transcript_24405/g.56245 Transcript_24405/m.56245 type:complete len:355 (+) Transcript_24405:61-1125(+)
MAKGLGVELVDLLGGTDGSTLELLRDDKKPSVGDIFAFAAPPSATTADDDHPPSPGPSVDAIGVADAFVGAMLEDTVRRVAKLALMITATTSRADGWAAASALEGRAGSDADADADADSSVAPKGEVWTEENQASVEVARLDEDSGILSIAELFVPLHEGEAIAPAKPNMPAATTLPVAKDVAEVVVPPLRLATAEEVLVELGQASLEEGLLSFLAADEGGRRHDAGVEGEAAASSRTRWCRPCVHVQRGVAVDQGPARDTRYGPSFERCVVRRRRHAHHRTWRGRLRLLPVSDQAVGGRVSLRLHGPSLYCAAPFAPGALGDLPRDHGGVLRRYEWAPPRGWLGHLALKVYCT